MVTWKQANFGNQVPNERNLITGKGCKYREFAVTKHERGAWSLHHLPSGEYLGICSDIEKSCQKAAEYLLTSGLDWDFPTIHEVMENAELSLDNFKDLLSDAALEASEGCSIYTISYKIDGNMVQKHHTKNDGIITMWRTKDGYFEETNSFVDIAQSVVIDKNLIKNRRHY